MRPNDLGKNFLVEECSKIKVEDFLKRCRNNLKELIIGSELDASGWKVELTTSKTHYNGMRLWFKCPVCGLRIGVLFKHHLTDLVGCRRCLGLEYRKRRYKGMVENDLLAS